MMLNIYFSSNINLWLGEKHMIMDNDNRSVHDEQFDEEKNSVENKKAKAQKSTQKEESNSEELKEEQATETTSEVKADNIEADEELTDKNTEETASKDSDVDKTGDIQSEDKKLLQEEKKEEDSAEEENEETSEQQTEESSDFKKKESQENEEDADEEEVNTDGYIKAEEDSDAEIIEVSEMTADEKESEDESEKKDESEMQVEKPDYSEFNKEQLVKALEEFILADTIDNIHQNVDEIKILFYKKHKAELEATKNKFLQEGGNIEDFKPVPDPQEVKLKELLLKFRNQKADYNRKLEEDKKIHLELKYKVIEEIKDLANRKESINKTFQDFRELQQKWREIGLVPQQNVKDLWESYHLACEMFYDYIKINKELRDLDLKKNLEAKIALCERAEKLLLEPSVVNAFKILQTLHDRWREIGPVPIDKKTEIWERFKEITSKINKRHHQYFENLKDNQKKNLAEKTVLCEKVEEINLLELKSAKEWEEKSKEIIEIQKIWKTIGFAPKKDNNKIYSSFRNACDTYFNKKREFFAVNKEEQKNNLQLKVDLCVQAETLKDSADWKNTTEEMINLQKRWKEIGPVPKKYSDHIWERFRLACDFFFEKKSEFFSNIDNSYESNLKKKKDLIEKIEKYEIISDIEKNFEKIGEFQKKWTEIGFVPIQNKEEIQTQYRETINKLFDKLKVDDDEKNILKYHNKLNDIYSKPNASHKIKQERDKLIKKLTTLENDIVVWENNIGFFSESKNANSLIKDVKTKIENGKKSIELMKIKIRAIDEFRADNNID